MCLLVQFWQVVFASLQVEFPQVGISLVDASHCVSPQADELSSIISEGASRLFFIASFIKALHFRQSDSVDSGIPVRNEFIQCASFGSGFCEQRVQRSAAEAVGISHQHYIVCFQPGFHVMQNVVQIKLVLPCAVPVSGRPAGVREGDNLYLQRIEQVPQEAGKACLLQIGEENQLCQRVIVLECPEKRDLNLHIDGMYE